MRLLALALCALMCACTAERSQGGSPYLFNMIQFPVMVVSDAPDQEELICRFNNIFDKDIFSFAPHPDKISVEIVPDAFDGTSTAGHASSSFPNGHLDCDVVIDSFVVEKDNFYVNSYSIIFLHELSHCIGATHTEQLDTLMHRGASGKIDEIERKICNDIQFLEFMAHTHHTFADEDICGPFWDELGLEPDY